MKRVRLVMCMLSMISCGVALMLMTKSAHSTNKAYDITIDSYLSPSTHIKIVDAIYAHYPDNSIQVFAQKLHALFPYIRAVKTGIVSPECISIAVEAQAPCFAINDTALLLDNGCIVERSSYNEADLVGIQHITVAENQIPSLPPHFKSILDHLFTISEHSYAITWRHEHEIFMVDKNNRKFLLLCSSDTLPDKNTLQQCTHIYDELHNQMYSEKKSLKQPKIWAADIRFKNQIVMRAEVGGAYG